MDECVDANYDAVETVIPASANPGDTLQVKQPECVQAALRQWSVVTE